MSVQAYLRQAFAAQPFSQPQAQELMQSLIDGHFAPEQVGALLGALATRWPTAAELTGFAQALRAAMLPVPLPAELAALDTCGTGGDGGCSFNVSTAVALVVAACGVPVVKHGNRAVSSAAGSSDVLAALGIAMQHSPAEAAVALQQHGIAFCFAPAFHPALKAVAEVRRSLGVRTLFNLLGPLCNPAQVPCQLLGVFDPALTPIMAEALHNLGTRSALVVSAYAGLDELSLQGKTRCSRLHQGQIQSFDFEPGQLHLPEFPLAEIAGGDAAHNARLIEALLSGEQVGASRHLLSLNAAAALWVAGQAADLSQGLELAEACLNQGRALAGLQALQARQQP